MLVVDFFFNYNVCFKLTNDQSSAYIMLLHYEIVWQNILNSDISQFRNTCKTRSVITTGQHKEIGNAMTAIANCFKMFFDLQLAPELSTAVVFSITFLLALQALDAQIPWQEALRAICPHFGNIIGILRMGDDLSRMITSTAQTCGDRQGGLGWIAHAVQHAADLAKACIPITYKSGPTAQATVGVELLQSAYIRLAYALDRSLNTCRLAQETDFPEFLRLVDASSAQPFSISGSRSTDYNTNTAYRPCADTKCCHVTLKIQVHVTPDTKEKPDARDTDETQRGVGAFQGPKLIQAYPDDLSPADESDTRISTIATALEQEGWTQFRDMTDITHGCSVSTQSHDGSDLAR